MADLACSDEVVVAFCADVVIAVTALVAVEACTVGRYWPPTNIAVRENWEYDIAVLP